MTLLGLAAAMGFKDTDAMEVLKQSGGTIGKKISTEEYPKIFVDALTLRVPKERAK